MRILRWRRSNHVPVHVRSHLRAGRPLDLDLICQRGSISYTDIAAELYIARMSAMTAIRQLELEQLIEKVVGHGRVPNRYVLKEPQP